MYSFGSRKKKLAIAFQFEFANTAAWKCDSCRKSGLEKKRRCGWLPESLIPVERVVWARGAVTTTRCPVSIVTAESRTWMEEFLVWKRFGGQGMDELPARTVEAFLILDNELKKEIQSGQA